MLMLVLHVGYEYRLLLLLVVMLLIVLLLHFFYYLSKIQQRH